MDWVLVCDLTVCWGQFGLTWRGPIEIAVITHPIQPPAKIAIASRAVAANLEADFSSLSFSLFILSPRFLLFIWNLQLVKREWVAIYHSLCDPIGIPLWKKVQCFVYGNSRSLRIWLREEGPIRGKYRSSECPVGLHSSRTRKCDNRHIS